MQHPYSTMSVPNGTAWLYCKGIPTLLEVTEACRHSSKKRDMITAIPVGSVIATMVPVPAELVSTVDVCSTPAPKTTIASSKAVGAEQKLIGLLPLSNGAHAAKSSGNRSTRGPSPLVRLRLPSSYLDISVKDVCEHC